MTFLSPLLFVGMACLVGYLASLNNDELVTVAVHDADGVLKNELKSDQKFKYTDLSSMPLNKAKEEAAKDYNGLLYIPHVDNVQALQSKVEFISEDSPNMELVSELEHAIDDKVTRENLKALNFDYDKIEQAKADTSLHLSKFSGEETNKEASYIKVGFGGLAGYLIMMFVIIYGNMVMRSVIEEKTNRIIEIIISSVKPFQLMMGKIVGTSLAGVLQFLIWAILGTVLFVVLGSIFNVPMGGGAGMAQEQMAQAQESASGVGVLINEIFKLPLGTMFTCFIIYFIGGYFLYSSLYAAIGAAVDSETDTQQFVLPIILPLMLGVYVGFFTVVSDPHGTVATVFSMIPLTSPIVMMMRIPFGVPLWEIIVSMAILFGTFIAVVWFAGKVYRIGILMYGKKPTYAEIIKWMKYKG